MKILNIHRKWAVTTWGLVVLAGSQAMVGCNRTASSYVPKKSEQLTETKVQPGQEASLFPFKVGNQWTYTVEINIQNGNQRQTRSAEVTWRIAKVASNGGATTATIDVVQDGNVRDRQLWRSDSKGLYQLSIGVQPKAFSSPKPVLLFPLEEGRKFSWTGTGPNSAGGMDQAKETNEINGTQIVDTDLGPVTAYSVDSKSTFQVTVRPAPNQPERKVPATMTATTWFSPNIGLVRAVQTTVVGNQAGQKITLRLKSRSLK
jgi:hypothetical protein